MLCRILAAIALLGGVGLGVGGAFPLAGLEAAPAPDVPPKLTDGQRAKIDPLVWRAVSDGPAYVLVHLAEAPVDPPPSLAGQAQGNAEAKAERKRNVVNKLQRHAQTTQTGVLALLSQAAKRTQALQVEPFWIVNAIAAQVDRDTLLRLAAHPDVLAIRPNRVYRTEDLLPQADDGRWTIDDRQETGDWRLETNRPSSSAKYQSPVTRLQSSVFNPQSLIFNLQSSVFNHLSSIFNLQSSSLLPWGLQRIGADRVWQELGLRGQGVTVATVDTGVQWTHPALRPSYRGKSGDHAYAWFDASGESPDEPIDLVGHGTHVMGTLVGDDGQYHVGVAPEAEWLAVRIFGKNGASDIIVHRAFQWLLAPTDLRGQNPDPGRAPDIVNHSWGHPNGANPSYEADTRRVREAGILQIFAAGNEGYLGEGTIRTPGAFETVFTVGNVNADDLLNGSSSQGPAFNGNLKPDLAAPGTSVLSTYPFDDYVEFDGTSMAAPHVTGAAALMLQANPRLSVDDLEQILRLTAKDLGAPGPDTRFGAGRLDAFKAAQWATSAGQLGGHITTAHGGYAIRRPLDDISSGSTTTATVRGVRQPDGVTFTTQTDAQGVYTVSVPSGVYSLTSEAPGYTTSTPVTVEVRTGLRSVYDLSLTPAPRYPVTGRVTALGTGVGVPASVAALNTPFQTTANAEGQYRLELPAGTYSLEVRVLRYRVERVEVTVGPTAPSAQVDLALPGAPSVLLVDADAWSVDNVSPYYRRALNDSGFQHDTRVITDTRPFGSLDQKPVIQLPSLAELRRYDSVVWVQSYSSPGRLSRDLAGNHDAVSLLKGYLDTGGRLLLVGQDIGFLDGFSDFNRPAYAPEFYRDVLRARFEADVAGPATAQGTPGDLFDGVKTQLSASTGYRRPGACGATGGLCPDVIAAREGAKLVMAYSPLDGAGLRTTIGPGRLVYLAFNLDGAARVEQAETIRRALTWLALPSLDYRADRAEARPGDTITYTAVFTSVALSDTPGVSLTATIPSGVMVDPASLSQGATLDTTAGVVRWVGVLPAQGTARVSFRGRLPQTALGGQELHSEATLAVGHDTASQAVSLPLLASNLSEARKTVFPYVARPGGVLTYTITLTNTGSITAENARLSDPLPPGTELIPASLHGGATYQDQTRRIEWTGVIPPSIGPLNYAWTDSQQPGGASYGWYELTATAGMTPTRVINAAPGLDDVSFGPFDLGFDFPFYGRWRDQVWVADNGWLSFANAPNVLVEPVRMPCAGNPRCAQAPRPVVAPFWYDLTLLEGSIKFWTNRRDLAVISWEAVKSYNLEGPYTFQVVLRGDGSMLFQYRSMASPVNQAGGGILDDDGSRGLQVYHQQSYVRNGLAVRITPQGPPPPPTLRFAVRLLDTAPPLVTNTATITDGRGLAYTLSAAASANPPSLASSTAQVSAALAPPGSEVSYSLTLRNSGGAGMITLTNPLPEGLTLVPGSLSPGASYDAPARRIQWSGALALGAEQVITYRALLPDKPLGSVVTNTTRVEDGIHPPLFLTSVTELQAIDLSRAEKLVSQTEAVSGDVLTYTVRLGNAGRAPAETVLVTDTLPAGLVYVPNSATDGASYDPARQQITWLGRVPGREPYQAERVAYAWRDIIAAGTVVHFPDRQDAVSDSLPMGFTFPFFGDNVDQFRVSPNGWLTFGSQSRQGEGRPLPDPNAPRSLVAPFWADLRLDTRGQVFYLAEPDRLTVTWRRAIGQVGTGEYTFQAILQRDGTIIFQYQTMDGDRVSYATVGIQDSAGREGMTMAQGPAQRVTAGDAFRLRLPTPRQFSFRARVAEGLPLNQVITNTVSLTTNHQSSIINRLSRSAVVRVNTLDLSSSTYQATPAVVNAGERVEFRLSLLNNGLVDATGVVVALGVPSGVAPGSVTPLGGASLVDGRVTWAGRVPARGTIVLGFAATASTPGTRLVSEALVTPPGGSPRVPRLTAQTETLAPALTGSTLSLAPANPRPGEPVYVTMVIQNSRPHAVQASLVNPPPPGAVYVDGSAWASAGPAPTINATTSAIQWQGAIPGQSRLTLRFAWRVDGQGEVVNRATLTETGGSPLTLEARIRVMAHRLYLPFVVSGRE